MPAEQHHRKQENNNDGDRQPKQYRTQGDRQNMETSETKEEKCLRFEAEHEKLAKKYLIAHETYTNDMHKLASRARNLLNNAKISYNNSILNIVEKRQSKSKKVEEDAKPVLPVLDEIERIFEMGIGQPQTIAEDSKTRKKKYTQKSRAMKNALKSQVTMEELKEASATPEADVCKSTIRNRVLEQRNKISEEVKKLQQAFDAIILEILNGQKELRDKMDKDKIGDRMLAELDLLEYDRKKQQKERDHALTSATNYLNKDVDKFILEVKDS